MYMDKCMYKRTLVTHINRFLDMQDKLKVHEIGIPSQRSQFALNKAFSKVDTVVLVPEDNDTVTSYFSSV